MTGRRRAAVALLTVGGLAFLSGCSSDGSASGGSASSGQKAPFTLKEQPVRADHVDLPKSYKFAPPVIEVARGTTVVWTNHDDFPHTVQILAGADDQSTHDLGIGKTVSIAFDEPGTVYYHCSIHPAQMKGKVIVTG
jgi:plastocyanin